MIGDPAILFRKEALGSDVRFLDLGGEWFRRTGLPFVFALWSLKRDFTKKKELSEGLRNAKYRGLVHRPAIAALDPDPEFALHYLTELIHYDLAEEEKRGLMLFRESLGKMKLGPDKAQFACLDTTTFMVSATENDGVIDITNYLLSLA